MPDDAGLLPAVRRDRALAALDAAARAWGGEPQSPGERSAYADRGVTHGWRLPVDFSEAAEQAHLFVEHRLKSAFQHGVTERLWITGLLRNGEDGVLEDAMTQIAS